MWVLWIMGDILLYLLFFFDLPAPPLLFPLQDWAPNFTMQPHFLRPSSVSEGPLAQNPWTGSGCTSTPVSSFPSQLSCSIKLAQKAFQIHNAGTF